MARQKTVFKASQVIHLWAHQAQEHARTVACKGPAGRYGYGRAVNPEGTSACSFIGPVLYSYRTPIAVIHKAKTGKVALITDEKFSVTTFGQQSEARCACRGVLPVYVVPHIGLAPHAPYGRGRAPVKDWRVRNRDYLAGLYADECDRLMRSMRPPWHYFDNDAEQKAARYGDIVRARLDELANTAREYCAAFGIKAPVFNPQTDAARIADARGAIWARHAERLAKREETKRAKRKREAELYNATLAEKVTAWRAGELDRLPWRGEAGALLRVKGSRVQTSLGAEVPVTDARRAIAFVTAKRAEGWKRNGERFPVGAFQLDSVEAGTGNVRAGCHFIEFAEVEKLAALLA